MCWPDGVKTLQGDFQFWKAYEASVNYMLDEDKKTLLCAVPPLVVHTIDVTC